jgi:hypothetical protein
MKRLFAMELINVIILEARGWTAEGSEFEFR